MDESDEMMGEGDREADRHYRENTRAFIEAGRVEAAAEEAKRALEAEGAELEAAERAARADVEARIEAGAMAPSGEPHVLADRIAELATLRDTLKVRIHLAQQELQDLFTSLEDRWAALAHKTNALKETSKGSAEQVGAATRLLIDEIHDGYDRLKHILSDSGPV